MHEKSYEYSKRPSNVGNDHTRASCRGEWNSESNFPSEILDVGTSPYHSRI